VTSIQVTDRATGELQRLISRIQNPLPGLLIAGREVRNLLRAHFDQKDKSQPNKLGGTRQNFWLQVKKSVNVPQATGASQVTISISDPRFNQKVFGGPIQAKLKTWLTIPITAEAYGRAASVMADSLGVTLFKVQKKDGRIFLAGRKQGEPIKFYYRLMKSVNQKPDPTALPPEEKMAQTAREAFAKWALTQQGTV
jgi:hypothetical protein